ncbi:cytochrome c biogenesis protein ResB [Thermodesulfobacteriota bacterium]
MPEKSSNPIWNSLSSVKLTFILLILLAITSITGTIIPQQEGAAKFAQALSPGLVRLFSSLQLFDMYHSIWFRFIICFLTINIIICSIDRFPTTLKLFRLVPRPDRSKPFEGLPQQRILSGKGEINDVTAKVMEILKRQYKNTVLKDTDKDCFIHAEKGRYTLFGVYLVHFSVLLILIGAVIGSLLGFDAYVNILEGEEVDTIVLRTSVEHKHKKLGFSVHCEKFSVNFYDNGAPKEYRSDLGFIINGNTVRKGSLLVNHPITFRGITFYQSSYGSTAGNKVRLRISGAESDTKGSIMEIEKNHSLHLPGNEGEFQVVEIDENLKGVMGPAALISIKPHQGEETRFWVLRDLELLRKRFPEAMFQSSRLNPSAFKPYTFHLQDIESRYYTGLQVSRDPGVIFVYAGFFMIMIGLFITFFASYRRIRVRIAEKNRKIRVSVAGMANKNPVGMERELDRLSLKISTLFASEGEING